MGADIGSPSLLNVVTKLAVNGLSLVPPVLLGLIVKIQKSSSPSDIDALESVRSVESFRSV